ncbi:MAG: co-chaperone GroES family protein [Pseudohongiellaceae bacterium]
MSEANAVDSVAANRAEEMRARKQAVDEHLARVAASVQMVMTIGELKPTGYRVLVKPIEIKKGLEGAEAANLPTLAELGFESKTDAEAQRQERGENHGIVMALGPLAYKRMGGETENWCEVDDVVVYTRYAGQRVEHPPGSNNFFQIINDDDVFGKIE